MEKMKIFDKIAKFIRNVFSDISDVLEDKAPIAVQVTQALKDAIENHDGKFEWVLTKLDYEDATQAYNFAKNNLPALVKELAILDGLVGAGHTTEHAWAIYTKHISTKLKDGRKKEWVNIASEILGMIIAKKVPAGSLILATQKAYHLLFGSKKKVM
jgi:hypothetical protein